MTDDTQAHATCLFCRIASGEIPSTPVIATEHTYSFRDLNPQAPVHVLVIPRRHVDHLHAIGPDDGRLVAQLLETIREVARHEGLAGADGDGQPGYRVVANIGPHGGMSVPHLHFHVLGQRQMGWPPG